MQFLPGDVASALDIFVRDPNGLAVTPALITYGVFRKSGADLILVSGTAELPPQTDAIGHYMATWQVPLDAMLGEYRIIWRIQLQDDGRVDTAVQDFSVGSVTTPTRSASRMQAMQWLRTLLRDNNPDRNYSFRPPAKEHMRDGMTHHFGYIWEDEELDIFLNMGAAAWGLASPQSNVSVDGLKPAEMYPVCVAAAAMAANAVAFNWVADEFDYSIGGKSLTIEKSSKYQSLVDSLNTKFESLIEQKRKVRHVGGVVQRSRSITISGGSASALSAQAIRYATAYMTPWM